jgi:hypothetical protein
MRSAQFVLFVIAIVGCGTPAATPVSTVTAMPDAYRRLELRGYSHDKNDVSMGQDIVSYRRTTPDAEFSVQLIKWAGDSRIKDVVFSCNTNEQVFKDDDARLDLWYDMEADLYALVDAIRDYPRAVSDLHEVKEGGLPVTRHEGRSTTPDGWQIKVIEDVAHYKPQYKQAEKNWVRLGMIWVTHLATHENMPAQAEEVFDDEWKKYQRKAASDE